MHRVQHLALHANAFTKVHMLYRSGWVARCTAMSAMKRRTMLSSLSLSLSLTLSPLLSFPLASAGFSSSVQPSSASDKPGGHPWRDTIEMATLVINSIHLIFRSTPCPADREGGERSIDVSIPQTMLSAPAGPIISNLSPRLALGRSFD